MKKHKNFSFDVGMTSLGVAVNDGGDIVHGDVLLMHQEAGSIKEQAQRRRMFRTREAHKAREAVLESIWRSIGKEPLQRKRFRKIKSENGKRKFIKTKADERLEREFPDKRDRTVYASSLLRIMLLEGKQLEDWQIYKALHASIQRRGYDKNVPWKAQEEAREKEREKTTDQENPENQIDEFHERLQKMTPDSRYHLPCYYDAWKMGLWDNQGKKIIHIRQQPRSNSKPKRGEYAARGYTPSRGLVTREIEQLLSQATKTIPALADYLTDGKREQLLYGEQQNALDKRYPSATKIDGILAQKYPRFENRIISKCSVMPRLNVCKAGKPLAIEVGFLLRLVNWRYEKIDEAGNKLVASLTGEELINKFRECETAWTKKAEEYVPEKYAKCFKLTKAKVAKMAEKLGGKVKVGHEDIPASKHTGRSRFSQPALYLLKCLILSEKTPPSFYAEQSQVIKTKEEENPEAEFGYQLFSDVPYKYIADDLLFLDKMGNTRNDIYIPDISLADRYVDESGDIESAIQRVISSCNWPELRHRLNVFRHELENLIKIYGEPDAVHLEFIREDFLSEKKKNEYTRQSNEGREAHNEAISELRKSGIHVSDDNILRYRLYKEQEKQCVYTGAAINISDLESYDPDHIFPKRGGKRGGGPDAYYNKVLTSSYFNRTQKGYHLPCECDDINWAAFKSRVNSLPLGKNKKKLLLASTREEAEALIDKYTDLAGTAYIARLARDIVCLRFGWQPGAEGKQQRIFVCSGGLTSKVSKKYKLYQTLGDGSKPHQKDRSDPRHHALDAMVISYLSQWARDKNKTDFFKFPAGINAKYFAKKLADVRPHYVTRARPALSEQPQRNGIIGKNKINVKEYKNISKDPDERGQWYTNKSEQGKGTFQHGYLFYKDENGKICSKTIHSFRSPYATKKEVERKASEILGLFYRGKGIYLSNLNKDNVKATQLGRDARLVFGEYRVVKVNKKNIIIVQQKNKSANCYRIKTATLKKIITINELMKGEPFDYDKFLIKKGETLNGNYKVDLKRSDSPSLTVVNTQSGEDKFIKFNRRLINHLSQTKKEAESLISENDIVTISEDHKDYINEATTDDMPTQQLPDGHYQIKSFGGGSGQRIELVTPNGTIYRVSTRKILRYTTDPPD